MRIYRKYGRMALKELSKGSNIPSTPFADYIIFGSHDVMVGFSHLSDTPVETLQEWYLDGEIEEWEFEEALERVFSVNDSLVETV